MENPPAPISHNSDEDSRAEIQAPSPSTLTEPRSPYPNATEMSDSEPSQKSNMHGETQSPPPGSDGSSSGDIAPEDSSQGTSSQQQPNVPMGNCPPVELDRSSPEIVETPDIIGVLRCDSDEEHPKVEPERANPIHNQTVPSSRSPSPSQTNQETEAEPKRHNRDPDGVMSEPRWKQCISYGLIFGPSSILVSLTVAYALLSSKSKLTIFSRPQVSIFLLTFLSTISSLLVTHCVKGACDALRWCLPIRPSGVGIATFLSLSPASGFFGVLRLLFSRQKVGHRWWAAQRLSLGFEI